jgi:hypothetical protein
MLSARLKNAGAPRGFLSGIERRNHAIQTNHQEFFIGDVRPVSWNDGAFSDRVH